LSLSLREKGIAKMTIPKPLIDAIRSGQVVLFLGAGASLGASHKGNAIPPSGQKLADLIATKFLGPEFVGRPLENVAEIAISENNLFTIQEYIASIFNEFYPADFHKLIPTFKWQALATTNYDLIIERTYSEVERKLQVPEVFKKNGERIESKLKKLNSVVYLKLHGCITQIDDINIPLILTPEQYITHKKNRSRLFDRLTELAYEFPFLFVGSSISDPDIRSILIQLNELEEAKPRSYLIAPQVTDPEQRFWAGKKITTIKMPFEEFLNTLNVKIPKELRVLATYLEEVEHPVQSRFKVSAAVEPSESLMTMLNRDMEYIHPNIKSSKVDPIAFYKGYFKDLSPIIDDFDVKRRICDDIMSEVILESEEERAEQVQFYLIKGHAGSGKSVILQRLAWNASCDFNKLCLIIKQSMCPEYDPLLELYRLCKERIFLFVDPVCEYIDLVENFILRARKDKIPLTIVGAERNNQWNDDCDKLEAYLTDTYDIRYLNEKEIEQLIGLLTKHNSLGHMKGMTFEKQKQELSRKAGRQLLVALHEATAGKPFEEIIYDEYESIYSPQAKALYLTICILLHIPVKTATCSGNNLTTFQSSNSLVDSNTKVAGLRQLFA